MKKFKQITALTLVGLLSFSSISAFESKASPLSESIAKTDDTNIESEPVEETILSDLETHSNSAVTTNLETDDTLIIQNYEVTNSEDAQLEGNLNVNKSDIPSIDIDNEQGITIAETDISAESLPDAAAAETSQPAQIPENALETTEETSPEIVEEITNAELEPNRAASALLNTSRAANGQTIGLTAYSGTYDYNQAYEILDLVNQARRSAGLSELTMDASLLDSAMLRSVEIGVYFDHYRPDGTDFSTVNVSASGENIAVGWYSDAAQTFNNWMNSSVHRANILNPNFKSIGIGCFIPSDATYNVQLFSTKASTTAAKPANKVATPTVNVLPELLHLELNVAEEVYVSPAHQAEVIAQIQAGDSNLAFMTDQSNYTYTIANPAIAKVTNGVISGVANGTTTLKITLKAYPSISFTVTVVVQGVPLPSYSISLTAGIGGSVSGTGSYKKGTTTTIKATPSNGYTFDGWYNGNGVKQNYAASASITVNSNITLTAKFKKVETPATTPPASTNYTLFVSSNLGGSIKGAGTYASGTTVTVTAIPDSGYRFEGWYNKNGVKLSSNTSYSVKLTSTTSITATFEKTQLTEVESFVARLYTELLNRQYDETGLKGWSQQLNNKMENAAQVANGFISSEELANQNLSNSEFVERLYRTFLNRASDDAGKAAWVNCLDNGATKRSVAAGFIHSAEFSELCNSYGVNRGTLEMTNYADMNMQLTMYVNRCYTEILGRDAESAGLEDWTRSILSNQMSAKQVAETFLISQEFIEKGLNNTEYVKVLYRAFLGREYDQAGLDSWVKVLNAGGTRAEVAQGFSGSVEFSEILRSYGVE